MKPAIAIAASVLASSALSTPAAAQDAAETAVLTSGSGAAQVRGQRSLGAAISGGMNTAANRIRPTAPNQISARRRSRDGVAIATPLPADVDPLEGTDAAEYRLGNGATIAVGGGFRPSASAACVVNCGSAPAHTEVAEEPAAPVQSPPSD